MDRIRDLLVFLLLSISAILYHPMATNSPSVSSALRIALYIIAVASLLFSFNKKIFSIKFIRISLLFIILFFIQALFFSATNLTDDLLKESMSILFILSGVIIGIGAKLSQKTLFWIIMTYGILLAISGTSQIMTNFGGFVIMEQYAEFAKNSFGPMIGSFIIAMIYFIQGSKPRNKIMAYALILFSTIVLITIRARAAFLGLILIIMAMSFWYIRNNKNNKRAYKAITITTFVVLIGIIIVFISDLGDDIYNYIYDSLFVNAQYSGDITSGRTARNIRAINTILESPLLGLISTKGEIDWVHNYPLLVLSSYGIIGGGILIAYYIYLLLHILLRLVRKSSLLKINAGFWCVLYLFVISMAEPTFPYQPGSAVVFCFVLLGWSLSHQNTEDKTHSVNV